MKPTYEPGDILIIAGQGEHTRYLVLETDSEIVDAEGKPYNQYQVVVRYEDDGEYYTDFIDDIDIDYEKVGSCDIYRFTDSL